MAKFKNGIVLLSNPADDGVKENVADEVGGVLQILSTAGCLYLVSLGGSARRLGATELASRGIGWSGKWVGFPEAHNMWRV